MTEKQQKYIDRMKATGGFKMIGSKGGRRSVELAGPDGMAERGRAGGLKLIDNLGGREAAKEYFSKISKIKTKKEVTND